MEESPGVGGLPGSRSSWAEARGLHGGAFVVPKTAPDQQPDHEGEEWPGEYQAQDRKRQDLAFQAGDGSKSAVEVANLGGQGVPAPETS